MYHLVVSGLLVVSTGAHAQSKPLAPPDAKGFEGECMTVEGKAHIYRDAERFGTVVQLGRPNEFHGYIIGGDEHEFPDLQAYEGRMVDITGVIQFFRSVPEVRMTEPHQLSIAPPPGQPRTPIRC
jgi:DNA/RNA endonuclease YhcR with UshA esterase domain